MASGGRTRFVAAVALLLLAVPVAWLVFFSDPVLEPPPSPPPPAEPEPEPEPEPTLIPEARVQAAEGTVEVRRGADGDWQPLEPDTVLGAEDAIRTAAGASVELVAGDHLVRLVPGTDLEVRELGEELSRFLLGSGMVEAEAAGERELRFEAAESDVAVGSREGRFRVASNGEGVVAVASEEGEVQVAARGEAVVLRSGEETLVEKGAAPQKPRPVSRSLLLKVRWPEAKETNRKVVTVAGRTRAGALVFVAGRPVPVDADGSFETKVRLKEGKNRLSVQARDVAGHAPVQTSAPIVVDTQGAKARFDTEGLWGE